MHDAKSLSSTLYERTTTAEFQADLLRREIAKLADIADAEIEKFVKPIWVKGKKRWLIQFWHPYRHKVPKNQQRKRFRARSVTKPGAIMEAKQHWLRCKEEIEKQASPRQTLLVAYAPGWIGPYCHRGHRGKQLAQASVVSLHQLMHNQVVPLFGDYPLDQIDYAVMLKAFTKLAMEDYAEHYIKNIRGALSCLLKSALHDKLIAHLPSFPVIPVAKPEPVFLTAEEKERILDAAANPVDRTAYLFMFDCGLRPGEVLGLGSANVSLNSCSVAVTRSRSPHSEFGLPAGGLGTKIAESPGFKTPKTELSKRRIPLTDPLLDAIRANLDLSAPLLFPPITQQTLYKRFKLTMDRADVDQRLKPYSLRHAFATTLLNRGAPHFLIQKWLGHTTIMMTENYAKIAPFEFTRISSFENLDERSIINLALYNRLPAGNSLATPAMGGL